MADACLRLDCQQCHSRRGTSNPSKIQNKLSLRWMRQTRGSIPRDFALCAVSSQPSFLPGLPTVIDRRGFTINDILGAYFLIPVARRDLTIHTGNRTRTRSRTLAQTQTWSWPAFLLFQCWDLWGLYGPLGRVLDFLYHVSHLQARSV